MLQKKQCVPDQTLLARIDHTLLDSEPLQIGEAAELEKVDIHRYGAPRRKVTAKSPLGRDSLIFSPNSRKPQ
jgi:hypothetical protein